MVASFSKGTNTMGRPRSAYEANDANREKRAANFAQRLSDALAELRLTHQGLAQALGVSHYTVDSWTRSEEPSIPKRPELERLWAFLEQRRPGLGQQIAEAADPNWKLE